VRERTLIVTLAKPYRVLSWAPLGGGMRRATIVGNHQVATNDRAATESPKRYLSQLIRLMKYDPAQSVMMMTGVDIRRVRIARVVHRGTIVQAWCTAGCSNALRVGDPATVENRAPGTINIIVVVNEPMSSPALIEAMQLAVEARVATMLAAEIKSTVSGAGATGTGTDCIAIAAPISRRSLKYCGKHTRLGELIGRAVLEVCTAALNSDSQPS
jgi:adenosylcobinamide kinase/adenosylcobinamide-phosphate guanylyltransferase